MKKKKRPESAEDRLASITALHAGRLTPDAVVDDARDPKSPLHSHFTWDDDVAAHQFRLDQARVLIRTVRVDVTITSRTIAAPHYVRDPRADGQGYVAISSARSESDLARDVMHSEMSRVIAAMERARSIADVLDLTEQLDELITAINEIRNRVSRSAA